MCDEFDRRAASELLAKNPNGYWPDHSTGVSCPIGLGVRLRDRTEQLEQV
jgi:hypothetical protein